MALFPALPFPTWTFSAEAPGLRPEATGLEPKGTGFCPSPNNGDQEPDASPSHYSLPSDAVSSTGGNYPPYDPEYDWGLCDELDLLRPPPGWRPEDSATDSPVNYGMICEDEEFFGRWCPMEASQSERPPTARATSFRPCATFWSPKICRGLGSFKVRRSHMLPDNLLRERLGSSSCSPDGPDGHGRALWHDHWCPLVPLDSSSSSWDATSQGGLARLHKDMAAEDPYTSRPSHIRAVLGEVGPSST